jgi:type I restriction enzyme S subunit
VRFPRLPIKDVCADVVVGHVGPSSRHREDDGIPFLMGKNVGEGFLKFDDLERVSTAFHRAEKKSQLRPGDVVVVRIGKSGQAAKIPSTLGEANCAGLVVIKQPHKVTADYLVHFLNSPEGRRQSIAETKGSTRQTLNTTSIAAAMIPVPSLADQQRIAAILDKAEALRAKRRAALAQLNTLTQAIFLDMFGDPATNPKGWPRRHISDFATVITGNTPSRAVPGYYGTKIEWVKSDNINTPHYYLTRAEEGLSAQGRTIARVAPAGSVLVTCIAGTPECIGNAAMTDREVAFNQQINALVPREGDPHFIYGQILVGKPLVQLASTAAMKGMVNKSRFERIALMWPPPPLQRAFADRVQAVQMLTTTQRTSFDNWDALFASLQHRAFRGDL